MSTDARPRVRHEVDADPWWGEPQPTLADATRAPAVPRRRTPVRRRRARTGLGWRLLALVLAPLRAGGRRLRSSERVRRLVVRLVVVLFVLTFLACSVGVILINNVVIGRTAELGELDDRRRELRRDNALLGAEAAQLRAPAVIFRRAERDLGMLRTSELPQFIWLDPNSRTLTPFQRARVARARAAAAAGDGAPATPATTPATKPATKPTAAATTKEPG